MRIIVVIVVLVFQYLFKIFIFIWRFPKIVSDESQHAQSTRLEYYSSRKIYKDKAVKQLVDTCHNPSHGTTQRYPCLIQIGEGIYFPRDCVVSAQVTILFYAVYCVLLYMTKGFRNTISYIQ